MRMNRRKRMVVDPYVDEGEAESRRGKASVPIGFVRRTRCILEGGGYNGAGNPLNGVDERRGYGRMIPSIRILCSADDARAIPLFDVCVLETGGIGGLGREAKYRSGIYDVDFEVPNLEVAPYFTLRSARPTRCFRIFRPRRPRGTGTRYLIHSRAGAALHSRGHRKSKERATGRVGECGSSSLAGD